MQEFISRRGWRRFIFAAARWSVLMGLAGVTLYAQGMGPRPFGSKGRSGMAIMGRLADSRPRVPDQVLEKARHLPIEALWGAVQQHGYRQCFVGGLKSTRPAEKLVGRAVTMRYLPVRPDLVEILQKMAKERGRSAQYNVQAGDELQPGDVPVVSLGGAIEDAMFMGDVTGLGMQLRGAAGVVIDGGTRDYEELSRFQNFPIYYRGLHASGQRDFIGVEWNLPVRIGKVTVLPGDMVVGDSSGVLIVPAHLAAEVVKSAAETVAAEDFKRAKIREGKHKVREIYPRMIPELQKEYDEGK